MKNIKELIENINNQIKVVYLFQNYVMIILK